MMRAGGALFVVLTCGILATPPAAAQDELPSGGPSAAPQQPAGSAFPVAVIHTNLPGHPTAAVPGHPGIEFGPGTGTTHFDRPFGSPNGNWILSADTTYPTTEDEVILVNGVVVGREGTPAPWTGGAESFGLIDTKLGINDAGEWVFTTNTDGPATSDDYVVLFSGGTFTAAAQEGQAIPALPPATYDDLLDGAVITSGGTVGLRADGIDGGPPTAQDEILALGATLLAQEGVTVPAGQLGAEPWENFDVDDLFVSADGLHWLANGDLTGATTTDDVTVVDGAVVVQEGVILPGSGFPDPVDASGIVGVWMAPNGDWFARGNNDVSEQDWVLRNGVVVATLGAPIFTGASEVWTDAEFADCFFFHVGNSLGNYVLGGVSDGPTASNGVLVLDGTVEVVREGDLVDLNGNGLPDDDAFFNTFGNDDGVLTDTGLLYFTATIKNGAGTVIGQGFFVADLSSLIGGCELTCPASMSLGNDPGQCGATVTFPAPGTNGDCGPVVCSPDSGTFFAVGPAATVTCTEQLPPQSGALGGQGESCTFEVTVSDLEPPALVCPADLLVTVLPGTVSTPIDYTPPTPADNCPGAATSCTPPSGNPFPVGATGVACTIQDGASNSATCVFVVTVSALGTEEIPALSPLALAGLALLLAGAALVLLRRSAPR